MAPIKCGYYPSSAKNVDIPPQYFTHIIYAFLNPEDGTFQFNIDDDQAAQLQTFTATLHAKSPPVKVLFAVGGGGDSTAGLLSLMASEGTSRAQFINSSISVARRLGFDGIDLDWEYPQSQTEMDNLGALLRQWRVAVIEEAYSTQQPPLLLTAAVYYTTTMNWPTYTRTYPVFAMSTNLDFINVKTYDYYLWQQNVTGAFAALHDPKSSVSTAAGITSWTASGAPRGKLIMGLPLYGRTWKLMNSAASSGIGALTNGVGPGTDGVMTYAQVVQFNQANHAKVVHDPATESVYSVANSDWISYDDSRSVRAKVQYAKGLGLGGHFFWQVTGDYQWTLSKAASESW